MHIWSFNIATTIVFIPLIGVPVKIVKTDPGHDAEKDPMDTIYLDYTR